MIPVRKKSSKRLVAPTGVWSVRTPKGFLLEGVKEGDAWKKFLRTPGPVVLLRGQEPMAEKK